MLMAKCGSIKGAGGTVDMIQNLVQTSREISGSTRTHLKRIIINLRVLNISYLNRNYAFHATV